MGSNAKPVRLKAFIDKRTKKVMFAEADEDFVEILISFLTLPLGTVARLSSNDTHSNDIKVGSLPSLYKSVLNLDVSHFLKAVHKDLLVNPRNSLDALCRKLKVNLNACVSRSDGNEVFLKKKGSFIVTDDLYIRPFSLDISIQLLRTLGVKYIHLLDERTVYFGVDEFSNLLKWSLSTNDPLTNLVVGGTKLYWRPSCITNFIMGNSIRDKTVKLLVRYSTQDVLCAVVDNFFIELLFSFLTIPLGAVTLLTMDMDNPYPVGINKVYHSLFYLENGKYLKSEFIKTKLLCPKVAANYHRVTDFLPIYEVNRVAGSFPKKQQTFIVSDDLKISLSPSISTVSKFMTGVSVRDMEVREVIIGEPEALLILRASLTSRTVLTDCLHAFRNKPKAESST